MLPRSSLTTPSSSSMLSSCPVHSRSSPRITFTCQQTRTRVSVDSISIRLQRYPNLDALSSAPTSCAHEECMCFDPSALLETVPILTGCRGTPPPPPDRSIMHFLHSLEVSTSSSSVTARQPVQLQHVNQFSYSTSSSSVTARHPVQLQHVIQFSYSTSSRPFSTRVWET